MRVDVRLHSQVELYRSYTHSGLNPKYIVPHNSVDCVPASNLQRVAVNREFSVGKVRFWEWITVKSLAPAFPSSAMTESTHVELNLIQGDVCSGPGRLYLGSKPLGQSCVTVRMLKETRDAFAPPAAPKSTFQEHAGLCLCRPNARLPAPNFRRENSAPMPRQEAAPTAESAKVQAATASASKRPRPDLAQSTSWRRRRVWITIENLFTCQSVDFVPLMRNLLEGLQP